MPPVSYFFWFLMLIWAVVGCWDVFSVTPNPYSRRSFALLSFVLFVMLGWAVYGGHGR
jgi:hypothetical protein